MCLSKEFFGIGQTQAHTQVHAYKRIASTRNVNTSHTSVICVCAYSFDCGFSRAKPRVCNRSRERIETQNNREMNVATVFKQSTTTSARMSTNIHRTELSSLSSIRFDQSATHKKKSVSGQAHHQLSINKHQIKTTTVLMESNSVLNVRQESDTDHHLQYRQRQQRRHSLSVRDERLLKILSAPPDEPLYINGTPDTKSTLNGDNDSSSSTDNLLMQLEEATSSITAIDDYENENLPPTNDKNAVAHSEGC